MDAKDRRLLAELISNARLPVTQLARKTRLSREVANYRLSQLRGTVITEFYALIALDALGYSRRECFLQLGGISESAEEALIKWLHAHPFVTGLSTVTGKWNLAFDVVFRDNAHLESVMQDILAKAKPYMPRYILAGAAMREEMMFAKAVGAKPPAQRPKKSETLSLELADWTILGTLAADARTEFTAMAQLTGMSANAVHYRLRRLEGANIIAGYTIGLNLRALGLDLYNLQVLRPGAEEAALIAFLRQDARAVYYYSYLGHGAWDLDIGLAVKSSMELRRFILDLRRQFGAGVQIHDLYLVPEIFKYACPEGVFAAHRKAK